MVKNLCPPVRLQLNIICVCMCVCVHVHPAASVENLFMQILIVKEGVTSNSLEINTN